MGITSSNKQISSSHIDCGSILKVTLALSASPDISSNPADIVLVLDRSGSMDGSPLENMKSGAKSFIDIIDKSTDNFQDGNIGSGSRIGLVSFSSTAAADVPLTSSAGDLKSAIDGLNAGGFTNHSEALETAVRLFDPLSASAKVIVIFTDGKTTAGPAAAPVADAARAAGIVIYCIGLIGTDGININVLNEWATDPDSSHVTVTPETDDLEKLFKDLAANISKPGATNIIVDEQISEDFEITSVMSPSKGTVSMKGSNAILWKIDQLGVYENEGASVELFIKHAGKNTGNIHVNKSITYADKEGNKVLFPDPCVMVECKDIIHQEPCPVPVNIAVDGCKDSAIFDAGWICLDSPGRILQVDVGIKHVCPCRRVALGVILTEVDKKGEEYSRGLKTMAIPAHNYSCCRDVMVKCITFVLPEELNVSGEMTENLCERRRFKVRCIAHYIDTDYRCCNSENTVS